MHFRFETRYIDHIQIHHGSETRFINFSTEPGYRHFKLDYTENMQIFWLSFEYLSSYLCKKMQRYLPFRECFNLILGEAEDMETKCRLCTLCLLSRGSRATFWLGQQWPQALHPPLGNSHPASNQLTILQIVCVTNIEGWARPALHRFLAQEISLGF